MHSKHKGKCLKLDAFVFKLENMFNSYIEQIYSHQNSVTRLSNPPFFADLFVALDKMRKDFGEYIKSIKEEIKNLYFQVTLFEFFFLSTFL